MVDRDSRNGLGVKQSGRLVYDGPRSEGGKRILLDNSRVYVRFLPFVSGRVHLGRLDEIELD